MITITLLSETPLAKYYIGDLNRKLTEAEDNCTYDDAISNLQTGDWIEMRYGKHTEIMCIAKNSYPDKIDVHVYKKNWRDKYVEQFDLMVTIVAFQRNKDTFKYIGRSKRKWKWLQKLYKITGSKYDFNKFYQPKPPINIKNDINSCNVNSGIIGKIKLRMRQMRWYRSTIQT